MVYKSIALKIVKINVLVFILWYVYGMINPQFMIDNFLVSWAAVTEGRIWTLITSVFSHNMFMHIILNMFVFYNFGVVVERILGSKKFLFFYLTAGVAGSLTHCLVSAFIMHQPSMAALGASGAVSGVILFFALVFPRERIFIFGLIPIPALWAAIMFTGIDLLGLIGQTQGSATPIGFGAHLGGALAGFIYYQFFYKHVSSRQIKI